MKTTFTLLCGMLVSFFCSAQSLEEVNIVSDGISRKFWIQFPTAPSELDNNLPLVITLHGDGGSGDGIAAYSGIAALASTYNFIGVFPDAHTGGWNRAVLGETPADDLLFMQDMIDYMCDNYSINKRKVYATGHSAGGFLAYRMAIEMADKIAAIAPVAANMYGDAANNGSAYITDYLGSAGFIKMPILHIHGDNDNTVAYPDPNHQPDAWSEFPLTGFSYPTCGAMTYDLSDVSDINANVRKITFCHEGTDSREISLVRIIGGGHGWPTAQLPDVAARIVQFLLQYEREEVAVCHNLGIDPAVSGHLQVFPNPVREVLSISTTDEVVSAYLYEPNGKLARSFDGNLSQLSLESIRPGIYVLHVETRNGKMVLKIIKE